MILSSLVNKLPRRISQGSSTYLLAQAAIDAGIKLEVNDGCIEGSFGEHLFRIKNATIFIWNERANTFKKIDGKAVRTASNKQVSKDLLRSSKLSVASGEVFSKNEKERARGFISGLSSAVVKPCDGNKGRGVSVGVSADSFDTAWELALANTRSDVIVEEEFRGGGEARYLVIDGKATLCFG